MSRPIEDPSAAVSAARLATLYAEQRVAMVRLAHLLVGSNAIAEELVQDAFASLLGKLDRADNPAAYLRTTVVNRCRSHLRRRRLEDASRSVEARVTLPADLDETWEALGRIPEKRRVALVLRFYEDLSIDEIGRVMRCRPGTVKSLIHRGLASLRRELS